VVAAAVELEPAPALRRALMLLLARTLERQQVTELRPAWTLAPAWALVPQRHFGLV